MTTDPDQVNTLAKATRELELIYLSALSFHRHRAATEPLLEGMDPVLATDSTGRYILLDALTTLVNAHTALARQNTPPD